MMNPEFASSPITGQVFLVTQILIIIVATLLSIITVRSYTNTKLKKMIFVIVAFVLFAASHTINFLDQYVVDIMPDDVRYAMFGIAQLSIMMMFFLAIIKK